MRAISFCKKKIHWFKIVLITSNTILLKAIHTHTGALVSEHLQTKFAPTKMNCLKSTECMGKNNQE